MVCRSFFDWLSGVFLVEGVLACPANAHRQTSIFLRMGDVLHAFFKVVRRRANEKQMDGPIESRSPSRSKKHRKIHMQSIAKSIDSTIEQTIETRFKKLRKSRGFGQQNQSPDRPGDPKSSPGGLVQATSRAKVARSHAFFFKVRSNEPVGARKCASEAQQER